MKEEPNTHKDTCGITNISGISKAEVTFYQRSCLLLPEMSQSLKRGVSVHTEGICLGGECGDLDLGATHLSSPIHSLSWKDTGFHNAKSTALFGDLPQLK